VAERDEEDVVRGVLRIRVGGEERLVPELKWRANREWQARLEAAMRALVGTPSDTPDGLRAMADAERDLVLAYDATGVLGDLEDATEREVDDAYNRLVEVAFPLAASRTAMLVALVRQAVESAQPSSTSGPSASGASAVPTTSRRASRSVRSSSSTAGRRSASSASGRRA
jgi:hypothetical protein